jgi:hypothetical protein
MKLVLQLRSVNNIVTLEKGKYVTMPNKKEDSENRNAMVSK